MLNNECIFISFPSLSNVNAWEGFANLMFKDGLPYLNFNFEIKLLLKGTPQLLQN